jgi:predicted acyl esterase
MTTTLPRHTALTSPSLSARAADRLLTRLMRLPGTRYGYRVERNLPAPARDGAVLLTDHYAPVTSRPKGTVLLRTPYGRGFPGDLEARVYADHGYHVVLQSCRGTFGSTGTFYPMANEADDAQDAVAWLRTQPWFDGRLATAGGSYVGWTQWALLMDPLLSCAPV